MPPIRFDCEQRSDEWRRLRLGRLCSSDAADLLATIKSGGEAAARRHLRVRLMLERLTGRSQENGFQSPAMQRGLDLEGEALTIYEAHLGYVLDRPGFLAHPELMAGCSPDGLIGTDGMVEIKVPLAATHLDTLTQARVPGDYVKQICHHLWISGRQWCDFVSYAPEFPDRLQLHVERIQRDAIDLEAYEQIVREFLAEVDAEERRVRGLVA